MQPGGGRMQRIAELFERWFRRDGASGGNPNYPVYTRAFDMAVKADDLDSALGRLSVADQAALDQTWETFSGALQGWRTQLHLKALEASARIRKAVDGPTLADTVVAVLIDQSGSMRGQSMLLAAATADVSQDFLRHLGCAVEILGFTTVRWKGGRSRQRWLWRGRPRNPGRLCDLLHIVYRPADDPRASTGSWSLKPMLRPDLPKENVDGEAVEWAASRLRARPETRKILLVISDGAPVDDSTLLANGPEILDRHLRHVIAELAVSNDIRLGSVGIGFDVGRYYARSATVEVAEDIGVATVDLLEGLLTDA
jgi:cobaltochelatase CobT